MGWSVEQFEKELTSKFLYVFYSSLDILCQLLAFVFRNTKQLNKTKCVDYVDTWQVDYTPVNIY